MFRNFLLIVSALALPSTLLGQVSSSTSDGGSVVTDLGYNIRVNDGASLKRTWVILNDDAAPAKLNNVGIATSYNDRSYTFSARGELGALEALSAVEIRVLLFDVFGNHMKTLSSTKVTDLALGDEILGENLGRWRGFENEVSEFLTSVSFIAHAHTMEGRVWRYDSEAIEQRLNEIQLQVTEGELSPSAESGN